MWQSVSILPFLLFCRFTSLVKLYKLKWTCWKLLTRGNFRQVKVFVRTTIRNVETDCLCSLSILSSRHLHFHPSLPSAPLSFSALALPIPQTNQFSSFPSILLFSAQTRPFFCLQLLSSFSANSHKFGAPSIHSFWLTYNFFTWRCGPTSQRTENWVRKRIRVWACGITPPVIIINVIGRSVQKMDGAKCLGGVEVEVAVRMRFAHSAKLLLLLLHTLTLETERSHHPAGAGGSWWEELRQQIM